MVGYCKAKANICIKKKNIFLCANPVFTEAFMKVDRS